jgi:hypothetical protein
MKRLLTSLALAVGLTAMTSALDLGVGATLTNDNYDFDADGAYSYGSNTLLVAVTGVVGLDNGMEIDPYVAYYAVTENDADGESDGDYTDEYSFSVLTFGGDLFFTRSIGEDFRLLGGFGAGVGFGSLDYPGMVPEYSRLVVQLYAPVAAEVKLLPNLGLRVGAQLASFTSTNGTYSYPDYDEEYVNQWTTFSLVPSNLSVGAFLYF